MSEIPALQNLATIPGNVAIRHGEEVTCWLDFFSSALSVVDQLKAGQVGAGDHAAILMANHASYYEALLGAVLAGVWLTPVNSHLTAVRSARFTLVN